MGIRRLQVVSVPVGDQERARRFYTDVLGFELRNDAPLGEGQRWIELAPPGADTTITQVTWFETMPPGSLKGLVLDIDDIRAAYDKLGARGLRWHGPIEEQFWGTFAMFDDPDGNSWIVSQSRGAS